MAEIGLECKICRHREKYNLNIHLKTVHQLTTKQYKEKYPGSRTMTGHSKRTVEYWIYKGHTYEESLEKVKSMQKQGKAVYVKKKIEEGLTKQEAQQQWNNKQAKNSPRSLQYYLQKGLSHDEAVRQRKKHQQKYSALSSKFTGHHHTDESRALIGKAVKRSIEEEGVKSRVSRFYQKKDQHVSKVEKNCFIELSKYFPRLQANVGIQGKVVDMLIGNLIIEFYGDFWHRNPKKYDKNFTMYGKVSSDVWEKDRNRLDFLGSYGYTSYIIWESEWKSKKEVIINEIKEKLNEDTNQSK
jgi:hypothetical protein